MEPGVGVRRSCGGQQAGDQWSLPRCWYRWAQNGDDIYFVRKWSMKYWNLEVVVVIVDIVVE